MKYPNNNLYCINIFMKYPNSNFFKFFLHVSSINKKKCIIRYTYFYDKVLFSYSCIYVIQNESFICQSFN